MRTINGSEPWLGIRQVLETRWAFGEEPDGEEVQALLRQQGLDPCWSARLVGFGAGGWVRLLDDLDGREVLAACWPPGRASRRLSESGASVTVVGFELPRPTRRWDLVCIDIAAALGPRGDHHGIHRDLIRRAAELITPGGRVVVVVGNPYSPLRALDHRVRKATAPSLVRASQLTKWLADAGLQAVQRFGLLRSVVAPVAAFDLDAPAALRAMVMATASHVGGPRGRAMAVLSHGAQHPSLLTSAAPAYAIVARRSEDPALNEDPDPFRVTALIGNSESMEAKLIRGEPPAMLEKHYSWTSDADAEAAAMTELADRGISFCPRLLGRPAPNKLRTTFLQGNVLRPERFSASDLLHWSTQAAATLTTLQRATRGEDDSVLVHGDYWLGNVLVQDRAVVGVVDWTTSRRGSQDVDRQFLLETLDTVSSVPEAARAEARARCLDLFERDAARDARP